MAKLQTRRLGKTGPEVSEIGLGCMGMSWGGSVLPSREQSFKVLEKAIQSGCNFLNTGEFYGDNEDLLKEFFSKHPELRSKVFISVKAGMENMKPIGDSTFIKNNIEKNIQLLGVESLDLYQMARVDPNVPIEKTIEAIADKVKEGKVKYIGLSEVSADSIRRAHKVHPIAAVEVEYSPTCLDIETNGVLDACKELGIAIIAYSPLGNGILTGAIKKDTKLGGFHAHQPRFSGDNIEHNLQLTDALEKIASRKSITVSQLCLAWVLAQDLLVIPIPGTTKVERLEENLKAASVVITKEENAEIKQILKNWKPKGERYPEQLMRLSKGDTKPLD